MIQKDLGPVSAYALAVQQGYEGTEEEWATVQMACAQNAELAAEAKEAAEAAKDDAVTAKEGAEEAKDDAVTAKTGAVEARTGAQNAQLSASQASMSATTAKVAAQAAQLAAETAQMGAEYARDQAEAIIGSIHPSTDDDKKWILGKGETHDSSHYTTVGHAKEIYDDLNERKADKGSVLKGSTADLANNLTDNDEPSIVKQFFRENVNSGNTENGKSILQIEKIQGSSEILHQLIGKTLQTVNGTISADYDNRNLYYLSFIATEAQPGCRVYDNSVTVPNGHKVYIECYINAWGFASSASLFSGNVKSTAVSLTKMANTWIRAVVTADGNSGVGVEFDASGMTAHGSYKDTVYVRNLQAVDLTRCFGKGNEPTAEEFHNRMRKPFYQKMEETLVGMNATGIACTGFNLWDGNWGKARRFAVSDNGMFTVMGPGERWTIDKIPVQPNTKYRMSSQSMGGHSQWVQAYEVTYDGGELPGESDGILGRVIVKRALITDGWFEFTTGADATHVCFMFWDPEYGSPSPKENDICVSRVLDRDRNTEYRRHERWVHELPTGTYFPNGMHGIGSVRDEITAEKVTKKCGIVDLEELEWTLDTSAGIRTADAPEDMLMPESDTDDAVILSEKYDAGNYDALADGSIFLFMDDDLKKIGVKDSGATDDPVGKAVYILEEPVEVLPSSPINLFFEADEYGTEEMVYEGETTPILLQLSHGTNFKEKVKTMDREFQSQKSMDAFIEAFEEFSGATVTKTWDSVNQKWTYEIN